MFREGISTCNLDPSLRWCIPNREEHKSRVRNTISFLSTVSGRPHPFESRGETFRVSRTTIIVTEYDTECLVLARVKPSLTSPPIACDRLGLKLLFQRNRQTVHDTNAHARTKAPRDSKGMRARRHPSSCICCSIRRTLPRPIQVYKGDGKREKKKSSGVNGHTAVLRVESFLGTCVLLPKIFLVRIARKKNTRSVTFPSM